MKKFSALVFLVVIYSILYSVPAFACDYDINRACNVTVEGIEDNYITTTTRGGTVASAYMTVRIQNKSECHFNNVRLMYKFQGYKGAIVNEGEIQVGALGPYENKLKTYRVPYIFPNGTKDLTCVVNLSESK